MILRDLEEMNLAISLKGAQEEVRDKIFSNVSQRVAAMIREKTNLTAAVKVSEVLEVRTRLMATVRGLHRSGDITWRQPPQVLLKPVRHEYTQRKDEGLQ